MTIFYLSIALQQSLLLIGCCFSVSSLSTTSTPSLWKILQNAHDDTSSLQQQQQQQQQAFIKIFGNNGQRGEYMDGYSPNDMIERCLEDYGWDDTTILNLEMERANMMAHLYSNPTLYEYTCMVTFAQHYVLSDQTIISKPLQTFLQQKSKQPASLPIFAGVVWEDWQQQQQDGILQEYRNRGMDYVRMHCNLMQDSENDSVIQTTLESLVDACATCQSQQLVPVVLLQVPWRVPNAQDYFDSAIRGLSIALQEYRVNSKCLLLETRPPIGISTQQEMEMTSEERIQLGLQVGEQMVQSIVSFNTGSLGFCVAGGSTKGTTPTAMQDDTQNAVRQGMRRAARQMWGYDYYFVIGKWVPN